MDHGNHCKPFWKKYVDRKKLTDILCFGFKRNKWVWPILLVVLGIFLVLGLNWWNRLDPFYSSCAAFIAITLVVINTRIEWENTRPRSMNAKYYFNGLKIMEVQNVVMTSEADARQWGMQLGKQMANNEFLSLEPHFTIQPMPVAWKDGEYVKPYHITFYMDRLPKNVLKDFEENSPAFKRLTDGLKAEAEAQAAKPKDEIRHDTGPANEREAPDGCSSCMERLADIIKEKCFGKRGVKWNHKDIRFTDEMIDELLSTVYNTDGASCPYYIDGEKTARELEAVEPYN